MSQLEAFEDRDAWADAAASAIQQALASEGSRSFLATGGTTPGPVYDRLSRMDLDWAHTTIIPTDDRFVDPTSPDSNEPLLRGRLLVERATAATFLPLKGHGATPAEDAAAAEPKVGAPLPARACLLGMGADGHFCSLFPNDPDLAARLDPNGERLVVGTGVSSEKPNVERISLTARAVLASALIVVFISGDAKRAVVERIASEPGYSPPIATLLRQGATPIRVLWTP